MSAGIVYYTDSRLDERIARPVRERIARSGLPVISVSLAPLDFGENYVLDAQPSALTMLRQIHLALSLSEAEVVHFCEHDVLYHESRWTFRPPRPDTYYYQTHVWRWDYPCDRAVTYDGLRSLSGLCCDRLLALRHYGDMLAEVERRGLPDGREPGWLRAWGYEPGKASPGRFRDEARADWRAEYPDVDVRHAHTLTPRKVTLGEFKHPPESGWREVRLSEIPGWDLGAEVPT